MINVGTKQIGPYRFACSQLGYMSGRKTLVLLGKIAGPAFAALAPAMAASNAAPALAGETSEAAIERKLSALAGPLGAMLSTLNDDDLSALVDAFARDTIVTSGALTFKLSEQLETVFGGDGFQHLLPWLVFAVNNTFASFFLGALASAGKPAQPSQDAPANSSS